MECKFSCNSLFFIILIVNSFWSASSPAPGPWLSAAGPAPGPVTGPVTGLVTGPAPGPEGGESWNLTRSPIYLIRWRGFYIVI